MKFSILLIVLLVCLNSVFGQNSKCFQDDIIGDVGLYKFEPTGIPPFGMAHRLNIDSNTKIKDVIDTLIVVLNNYEYFKKDNITFKINKIEEIGFSNKTFRIGIINLLDADSVALTHHFQGSSGGSMTSMVITSTLLQPQLYEPLFDGIIITYNDNVLLDMDHTIISS